MIFIMVVMSAWAIMGRQLFQVLSPLVWLGSCESHDEVVEPAAT
jgi:hypothetical protein